MTQGIQDQDQDEKPKTYSTPKGRALIALQKLIKQATQTRARLRALGLDHMLRPETVLDAQALLLFVHELPDDIKARRARRVHAVQVGSTYTIKAVHASKYAALLGPNPWVHVTAESGPDMVLGHGPNRAVTIAIARTHLGDEVQGQGT
jgi:hypothetical protein